MKKYKKIISAVALSIFVVACGKSDGAAPKKIDVAQQIADKTVELVKQKRGINLSAAQVQVIRDNVAARLARNSKTPNDPIENGDFAAFFQNLDTEETPAEKVIETATNTTETEASSYLRQAANSIFNLYKYLSS